MEEVLRTAFGLCCAWPIMGLLVGSMVLVWRAK